MAVKNRSDFEKLLSKDSIEIVKGEYYDQYSKFILKDVDGYLYETSLYNYRASKLANKFSIKNPHTIENIKRYIEINKINIQLLDEVYNGIYENMNFKCGKCDKTFQITINKLTRKGFVGMCKKCSRTIVANNQKNKDSHKIIEKIGFKIISGEIGSHEIVVVEDKLGYRYNTTFNRLQQNTKPLKTYNGNEFNEYNINKWITLNNLDKTLKLVDTYYKKESIYCKIQCSCGEYFESTFAEIKYKKRVRCERCSKHQSNISYITELWIKNKGVIYDKEYKFDDCRNINKLPFDYAILNNDASIKCLIEVDGGQHYYPMYSRFTVKEDAIQHLKYIQYNDKIKNEYCNKNGIKLIRIPFWYFYNDKYIRHLEKNINV